jgi:hypothetical protein
LAENLSIIERVESADVDSPLHQLRELRIHGIEVWPLIRVRLIENIPPSNTHDLQQLSFGKVWFLIQSFFHVVSKMLLQAMNFSEKQKNCVFFSHPECLAKLDGKYLDRFCDPIGGVAEQLGLSVTVLEYSSRMQWIRPTSRARLDLTLVLGFAKLVSLCQVKIFGFVHKAKLAELNLLLRLTGADGYVNSHEVQRLATFVWWARMLLTVVMRPWRFSLGFVCTYYSSSSMAFVMACRNLDVPVYDIQHGVQGDFHVAYRPWRVGEDGRLPEGLPTGFWCWDNISSEQIKRWFPFNKRVVNGGDVWTEYVLNCGSGSRSKFSARIDQITVVVTLQPVREPLPAILIQAMVAASTNVFWILRLHPSMSITFADNLGEKLKNSGCQNFLIQGNEDEPLPRLLTQIDLHVTLYSSVVIEAAACGVKSVLLDPLGSALYNDVVKSGLAVLAESVDEILLLVVNAKRTDYGYVPEKRIAKTVQKILENISSHK